MRIFPSLLVTFTLLLSSCSDEPALVSSAATGETEAEATSSTVVETAGDATDPATDEDGGEDTGDVTIQPRAARTDLTDPYCIDLEAFFAASYDIEVATLDRGASPNFADSMAAAGVALTGALEHAPAEHVDQLQSGVDFAAAYAGLSLEEAEQDPDFEAAFAAWYFQMTPDVFAEDVDESDFEDPSYVAIHAELLCGIDTGVTYSFGFGGDDEDGESFSFDADFTSEMGDLDDFGAAIDDIVLSCTVTGQREFEVDLSNGLAETLSFSGEVLFFDEVGEPTSGRSTFYATAVRPGERSAEMTDADDPTSATCEIDHMSWVRWAMVPADPADTCSFSYDDGTVDIELEVVGPDDDAEWVNVRYGLSDAEGIRRFTGLLTMENEPGATLTGSTFDFTDDDRFVTCEIVAKELL